jgi:hypothetical protein
MDRGFLRFAAGFIIAYPAHLIAIPAIFKGFSMGHSAHSDDHHHEVDEKSTRIMVLFSLALFFVMTCIGNYVFVASAHHAHGAPAAHGDAAAPHDNAHDNADEKAEEPHGKH